MNLRKKAIALALCLCCATPATACKNEKSNPPEKPTEQAETLAETEYSLVENGRTTYKILLPVDPSPAEQMAAAELKNIFYHSTDLTLETVTESQPDGKYISIGNTDLYEQTPVEMNAARLGSSGFVLKEQNGSLIINAPTQAGKIYGVYTFCEENLGYEYYFADEIRYVKADNRKLLDFDMTVVPSFQGRNAFSYDTNDFPEHAMRLKLNNSFNRNWPNAYGERSMWSLLNDVSMLTNIVPTSEYYMDHKQWYSVYGNEHADFNTMTDDEIWAFTVQKMQICYTEGYYNDQPGGLFDTFVNNLIDKYIAVETDKSIFMLGMGDNVYHCECKRCTDDAKTYKQSGVMMRFINKVADAVDKWIKEESGTPDRQIYLTTFAYHAYMDAPVRKQDGRFVPIDDTVRARDNVCIRIAPLMNVNYYWPLDDDKKNAFLANAIAGWQALAQHFAIWDYRVYFNDLVVPYPYWNVVKANLELYKQLNVIDIFHQGIQHTGGNPFSRLDDYVRAKLMWNLDLDVEQLTDEFIEVYYKDAAPYINQYLDLLRMHYETYIIPQGEDMVGIYGNIMQARYWPIEFLQSVKLLFDKAYRSIEGCDPATYELLKGRIDVESRFYRFAEIEFYGTTYFTPSELSDNIQAFLDANKVNPMVQHAVRVPIETKIADWRSKIK